jgi:hypothetical protein
MVKRDKFTGVNSIKFNKRFLSDDDCYSYLSALKWEDGYKCKGCSTEKCIKDLSPFQDDVATVNMTRVLHQERCVILFFKLWPRLKGCHH